MACCSGTGFLHGPNTGNGKQWQAMASNGRRRRPRESARFETRTSSLNALVAWHSHREDFVPANTPGHAAAVPDTSLVPVAARYSCALPHAALAYPAEMSRP